MRVGHDLLEEWYHFPRLWYTGVYGNTSGEVISLLSPSAWFVISICSTTAYPVLLRYVCVCVRLCVCVCVCAYACVCVCMCVCEASGMGLHLLHLTFRLLHNVPQKKTTCHCLIYGPPCVTLYHLGSTAVAACFFQGRKNISPALSCPPPLSRHLSIVNYRCLSAATPFHHPHPKAGPNPLSSPKAGRGQLAQGDQFRLEREVSSASSPWVPPIFAFIVGEQLLCTWTPWVAPMLDILAARLPGLWIPEWINS